MGLACGRFIQGKLRLPLETLRNGRRNSGWSSRAAYLSREEQMAISDSWAFLVASGAADRTYGVISRTWLLAFQRNPALINLVSIRVKQKGDLKNSAKFQRLVRQVRDFLHCLIQEIQSMEKVKERCRSCGERHRDYFTVGDDIAYWDTFSVSFVESLEKEFPEESVAFSADTDSWHVIHAWFRFIDIIVKELRRGYTAQINGKMFKNVPL